MSRFLVPALFALAFGVPTLGQNPGPTATPQADDGEVVKISTALIQLDVTVRDKQGNVVPDLRPEEIEVFENGQKQKLSGFKFVSNVTSTDTSQGRVVTPEANMLPPNNVRPAQVHRTIAIIVDDLTLSYESISHVKQTLKKFVNEQMQPGDLVAILRTGAGIGALQQFTSDKRQLLAGIETLRFNPLGLGKTTTFDQTTPKYNARFGGRAPSVGERTLQGIQREFDDFRQTVFATGTLGALNFVVQGMRDLPGRKSVMLLSDGFKLYTEDALGWREPGQVGEALQRAIDAANRASVVVYTVDARGLETDGLTAADSTSGWSRQEIKQESSDRHDTTLNNQIGLSFLAEQTGGEAILNTNDLGGGIRKILDDQSYYLVGYEPEDATFDPKAKRYNRIEVKVTRPELVVKYRSGFFATVDTPNAKPKTPGNRLTDALMSPFGINDIALKLNALYYNSPKGAVVRSLVHVKADDLKFVDEPDGRKKAIFDVVAVTFGENGVAVDQKSERQTMSLKKTAWDEIMKNGYVYDVLFPIKKPGAYQLRVAVRDVGTDKIGSASQFVEVPDIAKNGLVLSGVVLENLGHDDWLLQNKGQALKTNSNPLRDTSLRMFKRGTVLNYGFSIYNARAEGPKLELEYKTRIFRDGKLVFDGKSQPIAAADPKSVNFNSALSLGSEMVPGDYVLELTVADGPSGKKRGTATQFVQFEVIE